MTYLFNGVKPFFLEEEGHLISNFKDREGTLAVMDLVVLHKGKGGAIST